jgi:hypothetical protein
LEATASVASFTTARAIDIQIFLELLAIALITYGFAREDKVIKFEDKVIKAVKNKIGMK